MIYLRVDEILKEKNKTKYWLIKNTGCHYSSMLNLINNKTKSISFKTLEKICIALECEPGDIIKKA